MLEGVQLVLKISVLKYEMEDLQVQTLCFRNNISDTEFTRRKNIVISVKTSVMNINSIPKISLSSVINWIRSIILK